MSWKRALPTFNLLTLGLLSLGDAGWRLRSWQDLPIGAVQRWRFLGWQFHLNSGDRLQGKVLLIDFYKAVAERHSSHSFQQDLSWRTWPALVLLL